MTALAPQRTAEAAADSFIPDRSIDELDVEICRLAAADERRDVSLA